MNWRGGGGVGAVGGAGEFVLGITKFHFKHNIHSS